MPGHEWLTQSLFITLALHWPDTFDPPYNSPILRSAVVALAVAAAASVPSAAMASATLGRALVASGATIFGLGAATMVVSSVSMGVARVVVTQRKVRKVLLLLLLMEKL